MKWKNGLLTLSIFIIINGFLFIIHIMLTLFNFQFSFEKKSQNKLKLNILKKVFLQENQLKPLKDQLDMIYLQQKLKPSFQIVAKLFVLI